MSEWIYLVALFALIFGLSFLILQAGAVQRRRQERHLVPESDEPELVLGPITPAIAAQSPMTPKTRAALEKELREAGFYRPTALMEYAAIRAALVLVPVLAAGLLALVVERDAVQTVLVWGLVVAILGYSLPRLYLNYLGRVRKREIEKGLPVAVDLLALGVSGGQNILTALHGVTREIRAAYPTLADELEIVRAQAGLNTLPHALQQFADRVALPEVSTLAVLLSQGERLGTDIGASLME